MAVRSMPCNTPPNQGVKPEMVMYLDRTKAPIRMKNKLVVVTAVSRNTCANILRVSRPLAITIAKAPAAPMPAASVGVNQPP